MTPEQTAAYLNAQTACALIEMQGMVADNVSVRIQGKGNPREDLPWKGSDFNELIIKYGIGHNAAITLFEEHT